MSPQRDRAAADDTAANDAVTLELVAELREVLRSLHDVAPSTEHLERALGHARALRGELVGERRPRWYEGDLLERRREGKMVFNVASMFRGERSVLAPPLRAAVVEVDGRLMVEARVTCNALYEGPPGGVHGGYVAGMFDDVLGGTQALAEGGGGLTGTLHVRYRNLTPIDTELVIRSWIEHSEGRRVVAKATCHAGDVLTAEAEALFVRVDLAAYAARAEAAAAEADRGPSTAR